MTLCVDINERSLPILSGEDVVITPALQNVIETTVQKFKDLERTPLERGPLSPIPSPRPRAKSANVPPTFSEDIFLKTRSSDSAIQRKKPLLKRLSFFKKKSASESNLNAQKDGDYHDSDDDFNPELNDSSNPDHVTSSSEISEEEHQKREKWWNRMVDNIKYSIVSKESEEGFLQVCALLKTFIKDVKIKPLDITMCLLLLSTYHKCMTAVVRTELQVTDSSLARTLYRYSKFASAAYGWKLLYAYRNRSTKHVIKGIKLKDQANMKVLLEHTNIQLEDVICTKWSSEHFHPGHYVVLDHATNAIVVAIRGTFHIKDCLTDLIASYEPFMGGYAHTGILNAAKKKFQDLTPILIETLKKHPSYKVILVGHSLGAGTAALLSLLLYSNYTFPIHCYSYAPPAIMSLDLASKCQKFVTSIIVNDDLVPRMSWGSIEDLKKIVVNLLSKNDSNFLRLFQFVSAGNNLGEGLTQKLSKFLGPAVPDLGTKNMELGTRLYPPGKVYHIFGKVKYDRMEESHPSLFGDIVISSNMFLDHMPDVYEDSLGYVVDSL